MSSTPLRSWQPTRSSVRFSVPRSHCSPRRCTTTWAFTGHRPFRASSLWPAFLFPSYSTSTDQPFANAASTPLKPLNLCALSSKARMKANRLRRSTKRNRMPTTIPTTSRSHASKASRQALAMESMATNDQCDLVPVLVLQAGRTLSD